MKVINYISLFLVLAICSLSSCIHDDTTGPYINTSDITIETSGQEGDTALYCFLQDFLVLDATNDSVIKVSQTLPDYPLKYSWRVGKIKGINASTGEYDLDSLAVRSEEPLLKYKFPSLGDYQIRLEVSNEFGSSYKYFTTSVLSAFDAGLVMLSVNELGESRLSVLPSRTNEVDLVDNDYAAEHLWHLTGAEEPRIREAKDLGFCTHDGRHFVLVAQNPNYSYWLDPLSLNILNGYPLSKAPVRVALGDARHDTRIPDQYIFTEDGDVLSINSQYPKEMPRVAFPEQHHWDWCNVIDMYEYGIWIEGKSQYMVLYNEEENTVYGMSGNGSEAMTFKWKVDNGDIFSENWKFHHIGFTNSWYSAYSGDLCEYWPVVTGVRKAEPTKFRHYLLNGSDPNSFNWYEAGMRYYQNEPSPIFKYPSAWRGDGENPTLERDSKVIFHRKTTLTYYNTKNRIYWYNPHYYENIPSANDEVKFCQLSDAEHPNLEITDYVLGEGDELYFYVAVYDPDSSEELKGSIWVYRVQDMKKMKEFNNIIDKPIRIYYKKKKFN